MIACRDMEERYAMRRLLQDRTPLITVTQARQSIELLHRDGAEQGFMLGLMLGMLGTFVVWGVTALWW